MDFGLKGRTAVVPGASSGLGLAVARALAAEGANVVLGGRRGELVREEASKLPSAVGVEVDLTDPGATDALVQNARSASTTFGASVGNDCHRSHALSASKRSGITVS